VLNFFYSHQVKSEEFSELEKNGNYIYLNNNYIYVNSYLANISIYKLGFIREHEIHTCFFYFSLVFFSVL